MKDKRIHRLCLLNRFLGYGNPGTAKYFFLSFEEASSFDKRGIQRIAQMTGDHLERSSNNEEYEQILDKYLSHVSAAHKLGDAWYQPVSGEEIESLPRKPTERMQSLLSLRLSGKRDVNPLDYANTEFGRRLEFSMNLYPLGARSEKEFPREYEWLFGYAKKADLHHDFDSGRFEKSRSEVLHEFIDKILSRRDTLLFVMGRKAIVGAQNGLLGKDFPESNKRSFGKRPSPIRWSTDKRVWLTGHPSYSWFTDKCVDAIVEIVTRRSITS